MARGPLDRPAVKVPVLAVGDALALIAFVLLGLRSHDASSTAAAVARTAVPLVGAWFAIALVAGTYRQPGRRTLVLTWAVSVPVAVAVRTLVLGHPSGTDLVVFLAVTLAMTGVLLMGWRLLAAIPGVRRPRRRSDSAGAA
ncbi:MAG: DUF3054 domain-containing protein [Actinomycetota bacterium]